MEPGLDEREPAERSAEIPSVAGSSDVPAQPPTAGPTRLEALTVGAQVTGVDPRGPVRVIQAQWHGADCLDVTYRDATGRTDSRLLYRDDEPRLEQRFSRIHRIGQTEVCHMWNLMATDTRKNTFESRRDQKAHALHEDGDH